MATPDPICIAGRLFLVIMIMAMMQIRFVRMLVLLREMLMRMGMFDSRRQIKMEV